MKISFSPVKTLSSLAVIAVVAQLYAFSQYFSISIESSNKRDDITVMDFDLESLNKLIAKKEAEKQSTINYSYQPRPYISKVKPTVEKRLKEASKVEFESIIKKDIEISGRVEKNEATKMNVIENRKLNEQTILVSLNSNEVSQHNGFQVQHQREVISARKLLRKNNTKEMLAQLQKDEKVRVSNLRKIAKVTDSVSQTMSATESENKEHIKTVKIIEDDYDDLVFYDYSNKIQIEDQLNSTYEMDGYEKEELALQVNKAPELSSNLTQAIQREISRESESSQDQLKSEKVTTRPHGVVPSFIQKSLERASVNNQDMSGVDTQDKQGGRDVSGVTTQIRTAKNNHDARRGQEIDTVAAAMEIMKDSKKVSSQKDVNTQLVVRPLEVRLGHDSDMQGTPVDRFEFIPEFDRNDYRYDENGEILITKNLKAESAILRASFLKNNYLRTKVDLVLEQGRFVQPVPMFERYDYVSFLRENGLQMRGAHALVEVDETINYIELDAPFDKKFYLDERFQQVSEEELFQYVLIVGASAGNTLFSYQTKDGMIADQIVHLVDGEMVITSAIMRPAGHDVIQLYERSVMARSASKLQLRNDRIKYFNRSQNARQLTLNSYRVERPLTPLGSRRYYEINSFGPIIMAGVGNKDYVELPDQGFINQILDEYYIETLSGSCIVQLNITSPLSQVHYSGETVHGVMNIDPLFLDDDGVFTSYPSEFTDYVLLMGEGQGIINIKLEYLDGPVDILKTYCSPESYLVEQL